MYNLWNVSNEWQLAFMGHVQLLMPLLGYLYKALPSDYSPIFLITFQSIMLLGSVAAIWCFYGFLPALAMLIYYPFWANALFDFHLDHLVIPLLTLFFISTDSRKIGIAFISAAMLLFVKEPFALETISCGLYLFYIAFNSRNYCYSKACALAGGALVILGACFFIFFVAYLIPFFANDFGDGVGIKSGAFSWLGSGLLDVIITLFENPFMILSGIFLNHGKLTYLFVVFGLLGFISLLRPAPLFVALPILIISMLSSLDNYYSYATHYTAGVVVPVIISFSKGLPIIRSAFLKFCNKLSPKGRFRLINHDHLFYSLLFIILLVGHWMLAPTPLSRLFWSEKVSAYNWKSYLPSARTQMIKNAINVHIPDDPSVTVSTQNSLNWYKLAHRSKYIIFPKGVTVEAVDTIWENRSFNDFLSYVISGNRHLAKRYTYHAEFVIIDMKRPWFLIDKGCEWLYGECADMFVANEFLAAVDFAKNHYQTVFEDDGFLILKLPIDKQYVY